MTSLPIAPSRAAVAGYPLMAVLAIVSRKGGAGKTTLAINLAVAATAGGRRVSILDTDPQASALAWSDCRHDPWSRVSPCPAHRIARALQDAAAEGIGLAIVDTAPHAEGAALAADLVVVPCRPALFDLQAVPAAVVLNAVPARGQTAAEARAVLGGVDVLPERLGQRAAFVRALTAGEGGVEHEPRGKAAAETGAVHAALWDRLERVRAPVPGARRPACSGAGRCAMSPRSSLAAALGKTLERDRAGGALATGPGEAETAYPRRSLPVQLAQIRVADRLRLALDEATVATIAGSMAELGLQSSVCCGPGGRRARRGAMPGAGRTRASSPWSPVHIGWRRPGGWAGRISRR